MSMRNCIPMFLCAPSAVVLRLKCVVRLEREHAGAIRCRCVMYKQGQTDVLNLAAAQFVLTARWSTVRLQACMRTPCEAGRVARAVADLECVRREPTARHARTNSRATPAARSVAVGSQCCPRIALRNGQPVLDGAPRGSQQMAAARNYHHRVVCVARVGWVDPVAARCRPSPAAGRTHGGVGARPQTRDGSLSSREKLVCESGCESECECAQQLDRPTSTGRTLCGWLEVDGEREPNRQSERDIEGARQPPPWQADCSLTSPIDWQRRRLVSRLESTPQRHEGRTMHAKVLSKRASLYSVFIRSPFGAAALDYDSELEPHGRPARRPRSLRHTHRLACAGSD